MRPPASKSQSVTRKPISIAVDPKKAQDLRNRLIDRGISPVPLPSVKRPKMQNTSFSLIKKPKEILLVTEPKSPSVVFFQQRPPTSENSILRDLPSRSSTSAYIGAGKLRPSTASKKQYVLKNMELDISNASKSRPVTTQNSRSYIRNPGSFKNFSVDESFRAMSLVQQMKGAKTPRKSFVNKQPSFFNDEPKDENYPPYQETIGKIDLNDVDLFIKSLQEEPQDGNFLYCIQEEPHNPYHLKSIISPQSIDFYYTVSKSGVSVFIEGSPVEFTKLSDWLVEREAFNQLRSIPFFRKFRTWKTCIMWKRNVNRYRKGKRTKMLEEKLFWVDKVYSELLTQHRSICSDIERLRFIDLPSASEGMSLDAFHEMQEKRQDEVKGKLEQFAASLRDNINSHIRQIMDELREKIVSDIASEKNYVRGGPGNLIPPSRHICALYEKMGFPENMSFGQRSLLRRECSRFIRFSYLADFYVLESLTHIYVWSTEELVDRISDMVKMHQNQDFKVKRLKHNNPLFSVQLEISESQIPESEKERVEVLEFVPPPQGTSEPDDFNPNMHLSLASENADSDSPVKLRGDEVVGMKCIVPRILDFYVKLSPEMDEMVESMVEIISDGLENTLVIERWSRHPELEDFATALEEWDDKVAENWEVAQELFLDPRSWLSDHPLFSMIQEGLQDILTRAYSQISELIKPLHYPIHAIWENSIINTEIFSNERLKNQYDAFLYVFTKFRHQLKTFNLVPSVVSTQLIKLDCTEAKSKLLSSPKSFIEYFTELLPRLLKDRTIKIREWIVSSIRMLPMKVSSVDEFVVQRNALTTINSKMNEKKLYLQTISELFKLAKEIDLEIPKEDSDAFSDIYHLLNTLTNNIIFAESNVDKYILTFRKDVNLMVPDYLEEVKTLDLKVTDEKYLKKDTVAAFAIRELEEYLTKCEQLENLGDRINSFQRILDLPIVKFEQIETVREQLDLRVALWRGLRDWRKLQGEWTTTPFKLINAKFIREKSEEFSKIVSRCENSLPESTVIREFKELVYDFRETMPVVEAMRSPLEESHWKQIKEIIGKDFEINDEFTLGDLMRLDVVTKQTEIQQIATQAAQEGQLKIQLDDVKAIWQEQELPVQTYKEHRDIWILGDIEEMLSSLDDSCAKLSMIAGNRYVAVIREDVNKWKDDLNTMQDIMEEWITCQKSWMYLENIFTSGDIKRHLHQESAMFEGVDKFFRNLMKKTAQRNQALRATVGVAGLLTELKRHNGTLDQVQRQLNKYLETKRRSFPRFYFLSDDELLHILANAHDPHKVQPHLKKCFDNINALDFGSEPKSVDIFAMESHEGEKVYFAGKVLKARGMVEEWLSNVQAAMIDVLMKAMAIGRDDLEGGERKEWVLKHPGQVIATVVQINWCAETESAIEAVTDAPSSLEDWFNVNTTQLEQLVELVRGSLTPLQRKVIVSLITTDVHGRDIIDILKGEGVESINDFLWQQQLRYYWEKESDIVIIRQINALLYYGYEYMGATSRLVITPLTDRCWITITSALNIKLGASPAGPAGTGKTESTKDLAKAIGMQCVVFNCSEQITYKMMGRLFSGLAQQGAWSCLDEFNRIDIEVLSVIAQQLLTIQNALREGVAEFLFEDSTIPLKTTCGVFITMNPGYAGRTELPDNLKVCFRPVAMMIPDYAMIAEIMLFAEGFSNAKPLSKKMVQLYKLASEQLSQQDHYDFGMRAVKSVLVMAGELKRSNPLLSEDLVLIRAMRDSNIPKFLSHDIPLFEALVKDLFPEIEIGEPPFGELDKQITDTIVALRLQKVKQFEKKVMQLFDTLCVRFGVMLVGPTGSGKSTCLEVLGKSLTTLYEKKSKDPRFQKVEMNVMNPKCITMGELYGEVNSLTQDWRDGLASRIMRVAASDKTEERKWVIFDGPVDSLWIENMNTVLDDNMMLCLANGERIKLRPQMRILFEVQDLAVASPATVSRCGMVYLSPEDLGWRPYVMTWIHTNFENDEIINQELRTHLQKLLEFALPATLKFKKSLQEQIPTVEVQCATNTCRFLEIFLSPESGLKMPEAIEDKTKQITAIFVFSLIWGMGGALKSNCRDKFSDFVRQLFSQTIALPIAGTLFDYYLSGRQYKSWSEKVPEFNFDPSASYFSMVVPTVETTTYEYLLSTLYLKNKPIFFTGETGVGKSVIISSFISKLKTEGEIEPVLMNFSAQTSSLLTQNSIEAKVERKSKGFYSAVGLKKLMIFVDDVNMPSVEQYGAQPPIEQLRQLLGSGGFYDRHKLFWKTIGNFMLLCAAAPPGGGRSELTPRFMRFFNLFNLPEPSTHTLTTIFGSILGGFLEIGMTDAVKKLGDAVVNSTIEVYFRILQTLKPTPTKFHYVFNLRDVSKVFQGILMASSRSLPSPDHLARLWVHESCRVFHDRLINNSDRLWFTTLLVEQINRPFKMNWTHEDLFEKKSIMFSDILNLAKPVITYEEITDYKKLTKELYNKVDEYNTGSTKKMQLVFFEMAVEHVLRICRTLRQPRGNILLIGVGGSGKQTLSMLSSYILGYQVYKIELTRNYGIDAFREDLKKMMDISGVQGKHLSFIFPDTHISNEGFLEDINSILNTGEVTNLYQPEDIDQIIDNLRPEVVEKMRLPDSKDLIYSTFVQRVRDRLHIVLCMSPVGEALRIRCRKFPSLVNCATLDWFNKWPQEALLSVSSQFLQELTTTDEMKKALSTMCMEIHTSVEESADQFFAELRRKIYTTPKSYLDLISFYLSQLNIKKGQAQSAKSRLENGLSNLKQTRDIVNQLQNDLQLMAPELEIQKKKTEQYLVEVQKETKAAEVLQEQVEREKEVVNHQMIECRSKALEAEEELSQAMPILERAMRALDSINPKDIFEMKNYKNPTPVVKMVLEAVCILLSEATDWPSVQHVLGRMDFLERLRTYNKDDIPKPALRKLRHYLAKPEYEVEFVGTKSQAAKSLCMWTIAMSQYSEAYEIVKPKKERVQLMQAKLESDMQKLKEKEDELRDVQEKVEKLQEDCNLTQQRMAQLQHDIEITQERLVRAELLLDLLADEGVRWEQNLQALKESIGVIIGNVFLSAAIVSYLGPFTGEYRRTLTQKWIARCNELKIPCTQDFTLEGILGNKLTIQDWNIAGLPSDSVSVENGIIATISQRWPLMIDPQMQAHSWIKNMEKSRKLKVMKMKSYDETDEKGKKEAKEMMRTLEACITNGVPILFEDIGEVLDPSVEPIIAKQIYKHTDGRLLVHLGESDINYDEGFRLYLTTKLPNPHYLPEVCIKVNIINFTVTFAGLEEQLLADVVKIENNEVEQQKTQLIIQMATDNKRLVDIQNSILQLIADSSGGNILDDRKLIATMQQSKSTSKDITQRVKESTTIEQNLNQVREQYRGAATRGAILYFVVVELAGIDPMYQYSLVYMKKLFSFSIENSEKAKDISKRIEIVVDASTKNIYTNICRGLFETHKQIFSFLITTAIQRKEGIIPSAGWNLMLRGAGLMTGKLPDNPDPTLITKASWELLIALEKTFPNLVGLTKSIALNLPLWREYANSQDLYQTPLPLDWESKFDPFFKLIIVRSFRTDKLLLAFTAFVSKTLGSFFVESPSATMESLFADSDNRTPIIFVLSQGADPTVSLMAFAHQMEFTDKTSIISLGQGQGPRAQEELIHCKKAGRWLVLQNCHLAKSWMPSLEKLVQDLQEESNISPSFRFFLTSMPADYFPVSVLQNGLKITTEPPRGIKANMKKSYAEISEENLADSSKPQIWRKLCFGLTFFHAVIQERRKFGPLGFNIRYEFNATDLETSRKFLKKFLEEQEEVPWDALLYLTGHINYGGRVTDDWDRTCLLSTLKKFYTPDILEEGYIFSESGTYLAPVDGNLESYKKYIENLPTNDLPEIFGLHENANISYQTQESEKVLATILSIQPREAGNSGGKSNDEIVTEFADSVIATIPEPLDIKLGHHDLFVKAEYDLIPSLTTVLLHEVERFNKLLVKMQRSLIELQRAIKGEVVMSQELDEMYSSIIKFQIPGNWRKVSYPSLKPLASWVEDLKARVAFMDDWLKRGNPNCYWLSGFFFPQSFITGTLQTFARRYKISIDKVRFSFTVTDKDKEDISNNNFDGVFIYGLYLDGARWDRDYKLLTDQLPGELYSKMPVIHFLPSDEYEPSPQDYQCPIYKTSVRAGVLSTTGQSTNFILAIDLPTEESPEYWTLRGAALLCQLND